MKRNNNFIIIKDEADKRKEFKQLVKDAAYEGVMEAKLEVMEKIENADKNKIDYSDENTPITTKEYKEDKKKDLILKAIIIVFMVALVLFDISNVEIVKIVAEILF